jgi:catalase
MHRQAIARGRVAYEPNSIGGGCPFQAGKAGFASFPASLTSSLSRDREESVDKVRGKPEKFAEHYAQATLFWSSQSEVEKQHIVRAFRFELTKVQVTAVRQRVVAQLRNVAEELAEAVAEGLGITELPAPLPKLLENPPDPEIEESPPLSLLSRPGEAGIRTRRLALLVADGVDGEAALELHRALASQGAVPRFVGIVMGQAQSANGDAVEVEVSLEAAPSVLWDACVIVGGEEASEALANSGQVKEFLKDQYRHCKAILALGAGASVLDAAGIPRQLPDGSPDPGLLIYDADSRSDAIAAFAEAVGRHRHFERETDPPLV